MKSKAAERLGEKRVMNCGLEAEIVAYRSCIDLDVRFPDGTLRTHCRYSYFQKGLIRGPVRSVRSRDSRLGEKRIMNCGLEAEIVVYRNSSDLDVKFPDGTLRTHRTYQSFQRGEILYAARKGDARIGEKHVMKCGLEAEIVAYRGYDDMDVRFPDGAVVKHRRYYEFRTGRIQHPEWSATKRDAAKRIGEVRKMNCGLEAEIIAYRSYADLDVKFSDGALRTHCRYQNFQKGEILGPVPKNYSHFKREIRLGEKRLMNCGLEAEIVAYRGCNDLDVKFSDGTLQAHCTYPQFQKGTIRNPVRNRSLQCKGNTRIGEKRVMNCGLEAEIVAYRKAMDLDVKFPDGTLRTHRSYQEFQKGKILGPVPQSHPAFKGNTRLREKGMMHCGLEAEIVAYRGSSDIDVRFPDGTVVKHRRYWEFRTGRIQHPEWSTTKRNAAKRIGEIRKMNCGMEAEIVAYRNAADLDVKFPDGTLRTHRAYLEFKNGSIRNPNMPRETSVKQEEC